MIVSPLVLADPVPDRLDLFVDALCRGDGYRTANQAWARVGNGTGDGTGNERWQRGDVLVVRSDVLACALGLRVPASRRTVEILGCAGEVLAERMTPEGVVRAVRIGPRGPVTRDAGVPPATGPSVAGPLPDPAAAASRIADLLSDVAGGPIRVVVAAAAPVVGGGTRTVALTGGEHALAALLDCFPGAAAAHVRGALEAAPALDDDPTADWFALGHRESVRRALGVPPGSPEAVEAGIAADGDDLAARVTRAIATALRTHPDPPAFHPARRHLRDMIDPSRARATVVQVGVRLEAPDAVTLGYALGRVVVALAGEDVPALVVQHDVVPHPTALIAFL